MRVVVCGAGVIGAATAYFLARHGVQTTLIERTAVGAAASGKSGGFLAKDWCDGTPLAELAQHSFALHDVLAGTLPSDYGYRRVETLLVAGGSAATGQNGAQPQWLDGRSTVQSVIGTPSSTAQVDPGAFTQALVDAAVACGTQVVYGRVSGVDTSADGANVKGVFMEQVRIPADAVVFALGPWSAQASSWLPLPRIGASKGHSIVLRPATAIPAQALFVEYPIDERVRLSPEIIPRANGDVYVCGLPDPAALPDAAEHVDTSEEHAGVLQAICADLSSRLAGAELVQYQACYRPIAVDALPLIGALQGLEGAYVSTGHNCWGILNAPASGEAMAELILNGRTSHVDLTPFSPNREALVAGQRRGLAS